MIITKYTSIEDEIYFCKRDFLGNSTSEEWRKRGRSNGTDFYAIVNDAIYVPKGIVAKILPILQKEKVGEKECKRLFDHFRKNCSDVVGGRVFLLSYDDSLSYSSEISEISTLESLFGFEEIF